MAAALLDEQHNYPSVREFSLVPIKEFWGDIREVGQIILSDTLSG